MTGSVNIDIDLPVECEVQWDRLRDHVGKLEGKAFVSDESVLLFLLELEENFVHVTDADFGTR